MRIKDIYRIIIITMLFVFGLLAFGRTAFNISKAFTEERSWFHLNDYQKRKRLFGDIYDFFLLIQKDTDATGNILFITTDIRAHYLAKYYLYPRIITVVEVDRQKIPKGNFQYIAVFIPDKNKIATEKTNSFLQKVHITKPFEEEKDTKTVALYQL